MRMHRLLGVLLAAGSLAPAIGHAEDQRVINCPSGKSYCTAEMRPVLTAPDAARADALGRGETVAYDPDHEARKKQARLANGTVIPTPRLCARRRGG